MRWFDYLYDKKLYMVLIALSSVMAFLLLQAIGVDLFATWFILLLFVIPWFVAFVVEYLSRRRYYKNLNAMMEQIDKKTLITHMIEKGTLYEHQLIYDVLRRCTKSMNDEVAYHKNTSEAYREYIDLWIHEVKTPLSAADLLCKNNPTSQTPMIEEALEEIGNYLDQVLFYAKSGQTGSDYRIKEVPLESVVNEAVRNHMRALMIKKVRIDKSLEGLTVYTDSKWLQFIISQCIGNSLRYMDKEQKVLNFTVKSHKESVVLTLSDNGMGIKNEELLQVFDKGFVGTNGRRMTKTTGMGLYICKRLSEHLGIGMEISSVVDEGTNVHIIFPVSSLTKM